MTGYVADLSWKSGTRAIEKLDRPRSTMAVNGLISPNYALLALCNCTCFLWGWVHFCKVMPDDALLNWNMQHWCQTQNRCFRRSVTCIDDFLRAITNKCICAMYIYCITIRAACYMFRPPVVDIFREVFCEEILRRTVKQFTCTKCSVLDTRIKICYNIKHWYNYDLNTSTTDGRNTQTATLIAIQQVYTSV